MGWGDPHYITFDQHLANHRSWTHKIHPGGDFWLIRTPDIWVQTRQYGPGAALIRGFAAGGPFLQGNTLVVLPCWSKPAVKWNGKDILTAHGQAFTDAATKVKGVFGAKGQVKSASHGEGAWFQNHVDSWENGHGVYRFELPMGLVITFAKHGNNWGTFVAKMPQWHKMYKPSEVGGWCGNFNLRLDDDVPSSKIEAQPFGGPVPAADNLFIKGGSPWSNGLLQEGEDDESDHGEVVESELGDPLDVDCAAKVDQFDKDNCDGGADQTKCVENFCELTCNGLFQKALKACKVAANPEFGETCIMDICMLGNMVAAKAIKDQQVMEDEAEDEIKADEAKNEAVAQP